MAKFELSILSVSVSGTILQSLRPFRFVLNNKREMRMISKR